MNIAVTSGRTDRRLHSGSRQICLVIMQEWMDALRSRRALSVILLYLLIAVLSMNGFLSILQRLEAQLAELLQLPVPDRPGGMVHALWRSDRFRRMVAQAVQSNALAESLVGASPIALAYAGLTFFYAPLLIALIAPSRIADEIGTGAVRPMLLRTSRLRWSVGKLLGLGLMIALSLALGATGAWVLTCIRMPATDRLALLAPMLGWSMLAWVYGFAFLGLCSGLAHLTRSGVRATLASIVALALVGILYWVANRFAGEGWRQFLEIVRLLTPQAHRAGLWGRTPSAVVPATATLLALGTAFHLCGYAIWRRRDA